MLRASSLFVVRIAFRRGHLVVGVLGLLVVEAGGLLVITSLGVQGRSLLSVKRLELCQRKQKRNVSRSPTPWRKDKVENKSSLVRRISQSKTLPPPTSVPIVPSSSLVWQLYSTHVEAMSSAPGWPAGNCTYSDRCVPAPRRLPLLSSSSISCRGAKWLLENALTTCLS